MRAVDAVTRVPILNGSFDPLTLSQTVDRMMDMARSGARGYVCTVNVAILMMMRADPRLQTFIDGAALIVADGQPLIWVSSWLGKRLPERVTGIDLIETVCDRAQNTGVGVYFLGARREIINAAADQLKSRYPDLKVAGVDDGYFTDEEARGRAEAISRSGANILIVAMGVPRQEHFLEQHLDKTGVNVAMGVGGSFDVLAGLRSRAPHWIQKIGFEWLYRLAQEPGRLWRRYFSTNLQFLKLISGELLLGQQRRMTKHNRDEDSE